MNKDTAFQMGASNLPPALGWATTAHDEIGMDLSDMGLERVLVITDPNLVDLPPVQTARESLESEGIEYDLFDRVRVEPTDISFKDAIAVATEGAYEGYVAIGGGSSIDTAKAANLFATYPDDFFAYINAPIGTAGQTRSRPCQTPLRHSHHSRHGKRNHGRRHYGPLRPPRQNRHCTPLSQTRPRHCRSRKHAHHAAFYRGPQPVSTSCATPSNPSPLSPIPNAPDPIAQSNAPPIKAPTPFPTCGHSKP